MMFIVFSLSNVVVLVDCRGLIGSDGRRGAVGGSMSKATVSSFAGKMRDRVLVRYHKMSTLASGPSRKGSGH
ncbi:hypothetical protein D8674_013651 [Pyrus ussuriensis x Pyrus communis]|uniref:Secreted protein n=1 Tax=Pyrus ussuriensis x Pyrus communis TaxID=2448454 RepID=A0A5N5GVS2_9ROSA|nr:hypothetical protein D8674_013651 [Pyrus ussuriensis x Pyrus communis]